MANAKLSAQLRDVKGKGAARKLRAAGRVPAVIYGHHERTRELSVSTHEVTRLFGTVNYETTVFELDIEGEKGEVRALVREVQRHPSRHDLLHIDFHQIHKGEKVHVSVPIRLVGSSPGMRAGGLVQHTTTEVEVRCVADAIPDHIDVDISELAIGESVHVRDITVPRGVELLEDEDRTICSVAPPAVAVVEEEEVVEPVEEPTDAQPELIRRRREEEEEEG
jgi:large subunit ribosomal protein L25